MKLRVLGIRSIVYIDQEEPNNIRSEYFPRINSEGVQNGTSEGVLACVTRQNIEFISACQQ